MSGETSNVDGHRQSAPDGRAVILERIRAALGPASGRQQAVDAPGQPPIPRDYRPASAEAGTPELLELFTQRMAGTHATARRAAPSEVASTIRAVAAERGVRRAIAPHGIDPSWLPAGIDWLADDPPLTTAQVEAADGVLTTAAVGIADSGTFVLDGGPGQGRRILSLLPDAMIAVLTRRSIVSDLPSALARLNPARPLTFVSGPSATLDIELSRVDGVHGPRELDVIIIEETEETEETEPA